MNGTRQIYQLHLVDQEIAEKKQTLSEVKRRLADDTRLRKAREAADDKHRVYEEVEREQRAVEARISDIQAKLKPLREKAYSGRVTNPRELRAMGAEDEVLSRRLSEAEDKGLELLDALEAAQKELTEAGEELAKIEKERAEEVAAFSSQKHQLESEIAALESRRKEMVGGIEAGSLDLYKSVKASHGGVAVAKVERGMCQGCRIALPSGVVQQARVGKELVQCTSCGRILYVS